MYIRIFEKESHQKYKPRINYAKVIHNFEFQIMLVAEVFTVVKNFIPTDPAVANWIHAKELFLLY